MKQIISILAWSVLIALCTSCGGAEKVYSTEPLQGSSASFLAYGMGCPKCANNIALLLDGVPGVGNIRVDMGEGLVIVDLEGKERPSESDLARAIKEAGFTYKGMQE